MVMTRKKKKTTTAKQTIGFDLETVKARVRAYYAKRGFKVWTMRPREGFFLVRFRDGQGPYKLNCVELSTASVQQIMETPCRTTK